MRANAVSPAGASAMIPDDAPQVQWYLRDFTQTDSPADANIVVTIGKTESGAVAGNPDAPQFGFEEWWTPDFHTLTIADARHIFLHATRVERCRDSQSRNRSDEIRQP